MAPLTPARGHQMWGHSGRRGHGGHGRGPVLTTEHTAPRHAPHRVFRLI